MSDMVHAIDNKSPSGKSMSYLVISQSMFMQTMTDENNAFRLSRNPRDDITEFQCSLEKNY